jgi:PelA/Pel-15E family pectate lyase
MKLVPLLFLAALVGTTIASAEVRWRQILDQPGSWYASDEAHAIAENVLLFQTASGGWPKNVDMTKPPSPEFLANPQPDERAATIDNGATHTQLAFLARVVTAKNDPHLRDAFNRGVDYLLAAQYENGGWPQFFPLREGYYTHITFNDDAMASVLRLLKDLSERKPPYRFVDTERNARAAQAVARGVDCILRCQIVVNGKKTAWCAQHDEHTFAPAPARKYEHVSLSGYESVGIVRFLMSLDRPSPAVVDAIESAVQWFKEAKLTCIRVERKPAPELHLGFDPVVVPDPSAPALWARFYEIGTNRPIFSGRDSVVRYSLAEVEPERRGGYRWYVDTPRELLEKDYPRWKKKHHK